MTGSITARYARWDGVGRPFCVASTSLTEPLRPGHVLVAVDLATVCGSDLHTVLGHRVSPCPSVLGHEQVGTVVGVSDEEPSLAVDGTPLAVGDRVVWSVTVSCGRCALCERGLRQKCRGLRKYGHERIDDGWLLSGGFATHCELLPGTAIVRMPAQVPDAVAGPASCATATVACTLAAAGPLAGRRVLVSGAGMLGVTATAMAAEADAEVVVVDPDARRRSLARRFGAAEVAGSIGGTESFDVALELSGSPDAVETSVRALRTGGRAVLAGSVSAGRPVAVDPERIVRGLLTIAGVHNYRAQDLVAGVRFLAEHHGRYPFAELVGRGHRLDRIDAALAAARSSPEVLRQAITP
ncbi:zinc-binding dehydrogenase [Pseudonocardia spinosispora]|uniref:zinc-binding dehydrogenase n=1 Tax=Pseudonocardia spinosispora TaxID=103441 RepID=UPI0004155321|nr:zinc-binding dehydrogenase [Pseudonocardia spinosispora]